MAAELVQHHVALITTTGGLVAARAAKEATATIPIVFISGLNPAEIVGAMALIRAIRDAGVTVLMIEHHVHAVVGVSNRILVLNFGKTIAQGTPEEVRTNPVVIEAYLGEPAEVADL